jgi:acyl-CoA thioesterase
LKRKTVPVGHAQVTVYGFNNVLGLTQAAYEVEVNGVRHATALLAQYVVNPPDQDFVRDLTNSNRNSIIQPATTFHLLREPFQHLFVAPELCAQNLCRQNRFGHGGKVPLV